MKTKTITDAKLEAKYQAIKSEDDLQIWLVAAIREKWTGAKIVGNYDAGTKIKGNQAQKMAIHNKRKAMGWEAGQPDLLVFYDEMKFAFELKVKNAWKKRGNELLSSPTIQNQARVLAEYNAAGFYALFIEGKEQAKFLLETYGYLNCCHGEKGFKIIFPEITIYNPEPYPGKNETITLPRIIKI